MLTQARLTVPHDELAEFCRQNHIRHLGLFGSILREDFRPDSDVDVLVELEPGAQVTLFTLVETRDGLSALFGRPVDLVPRNSLKPIIR